jgi:crossover junction endodeoxyribonuclease RusA
MPIGGEESEAVSLCLLLPWPAVGLSPNSRLGWRRKAELVRAARWDAKIIALAASPLARFPMNVPMSLSLVFDPPTVRKRDLDNLISSCKSFQDGVCEALEINDNQIRQLTGAWGEHWSGGRVELRLEIMQR